MERFIHFTRLLNSRLQFVFMQAAQWQLSSAKETSRLRKINIISYVTVRTSVRLLVGSSTPNIKLTLTCDGFVRHTSISAENLDITSYLDPGMLLLRQNNNVQTAKRYVLHYVYVFYIMIFYRARFTYTNTSLISALLKMATEYLLRVLMFFYFLQMGKTTVFNGD